MDLAPGDGSVLPQTLLSPNVPSVSCRPCQQLEFGNTIRVFASSIALTSPPGSFNRLLIGIKGSR